MLPSFRLIAATFCCGFIMVFAGLRLATSFNGINQAMPVMAAHAAPVMVSAIGDQDLRRTPATVPVMYDLRFAVSASQPAPTPVAASPVIDRATPLMMPLVILPPIAQEAAGPYTPERAEAQKAAALPARAAAEPAPVTIDIPLPEPAAVDLTFSPPKPEADGRGGASQDDKRREKRSQTGTQSNQTLTVAALDIPAGTVELP